MWPYFAFAISTSIFATAGKSQRVNNLAWGVIFFCLLIFIGLRHRVGVDWNNYLHMIIRVNGAEDFFGKLSVVEPFYGLLLVISDWSGLGMYFANFIAAIFVVGALWRYSKVTPYPWLALMAAIPIYIVVISMSTNRQAIAAAVLMWLVAGWPKYNTVFRVLLVCFASGFHYSAFLFLAFVGWEMRAPFWLKVLGSMVLGVVVIYLSQGTEQADYYTRAYLGVNGAQAIQAGGALQHTIMNAAPALLYFLLPKYRAILFPSVLHRNLAFAAIATLPLVFIASTLALRVSIYWYPMSIWVWSALPLIFSGNSKPIIRFLIVILMLMLLTVWLNFANSAPWFVPYENALFLNSSDLDIGRIRW